MRIPRISITAGLIVCVATFAPTFTNAATLFRDAFDCTAGLITSTQYYNFASFPAGGTSKTDNPSKSWEMGTGFAVATNEWLHFGTPRQVGKPEYVRFNSRRFDFGNVDIFWKYRSGPYGGPDGYPTNDASYAVDLWVRYQTQYNLYVIQFDRMDSRIYVKRKVPAAGWGGPNDYLANEGVYYYIPMDSERPPGAAEYFSTWERLGLTNLLHDTNTVYDFQARVVNKTTNSVQIKLWRNGRLVGSWTDANNGLEPEGSQTRTFADHLALGYYNSMTNWQEEWGHPITLPGATGFRADDIKVWIDDFRVSTLLTNDSRVSVTRQGSHVTLNWIGDILEWSADLTTWNADPCAVSPLSLTPTGARFYRTRNQ